MIDKDNININTELKDRGICVIIPTYNNEGTITDVVKRSLLQCNDVIVVNDGSTDSTSELLHKIEGITVIEYSRNRGKSYALREGFRKAKELGFAYAITLDSDGQHNPEDIRLMLEANRKHPGCILMGQRKLDKIDRSKGSNFANSFSNFWFCFQTLRYLPDTQTGFRLYPLHKLYGLSILSSRYEGELQLLVLSAWHGVKIVSVPINVYYPPKEERVSHFRPGKDFTRISILNTILSLTAIVYGWPLAILRLLRTVLYSLFALIFFIIGAVGILTPFTFIHIIVSKLFKTGKGAIHHFLHFFGTLAKVLFPIIQVHPKFENPHNEDFSRPAIIICNHQSYLDLIIQLSLHHKIVFLTNNWTWHNPFFGFIIRHAQYYPVSEGIDSILPNIRKLVEKGYSVSIFPEGTRSDNGKIGRFHKGAFHIAEQLNIDIIPLTLYGANKVLPKKGLYMRTGKIVLSVGKRISPEEQRNIAETVQDRAKWFRRFYIQNYKNISNRYDKNA